MRATSALFTAMFGFYSARTTGCVHFLIMAFKIFAALTIAFGVSFAHAATVTAEVVAIGGPDASDAVPYNPLVFSAVLCGTIEGGNPMELVSGKVYRMDASAGTIVKQQMDVHSRGKDGYDYCSRFLDIAPSPRGTHHMFSVDYKIVFERISVPFRIVVDVNPLREHPIGRDASKIDQAALARFKARGEVLDDPRRTLPATSEKTPQ